MKQMMLLVLWVLPLGMAAQQVNLTGTWEGSGGGCSYVKMVLVHIGDSCYGYTYDSGPGYCRANFAGRFGQGKLQLHGEGISIIERSYDHDLARYRLRFSKEPDGDWLYGPVRQLTGLSLLQSLFPDRDSYAALRRVTTAVDTTPYMKAKLTRYNSKKNADTVTAVRQPAPASSVGDSLLRTEQKNARQQKLLETIQTSVDTLQMTLYDNGEMDNDTVTVFLDNTLLLNRCLVTIGGRQLNIPIPKDGKPHTITLFADNLGSIPPNTAFLVLYAGSRRYELSASFDLRQNAAIIVQYKQEQQQ